ncbi:MAG: STAS domain-containing protein [Burkholderiaceae bacterium]|jgi:phospholipid transport system transporter-binding protein|nr:STAS domain-containing protein [Burkholderiaceae bacterium]
MTTALLTLPPDLRHSNASDCLVKLRAQIRNSHDLEVEIQAGQLTDFDSSALAVLLGCRREAESLSKTLKFKQFPAKLRELALLYGVSELLVESA